MPIYSRSYYTAPTEQVEIPARTSEVLRAQAGLAWEESPLSSIGRILELDIARKRLSWAYPQYNAEEAEEFMAANGLAGQFRFEDRLYSQLELSILAKRKRRELRRQAILARAAGGFAQGAARLGTALGVSLLDPLNIATAYIPVVGQLRYARALEAAGGMFGRTAVRLGAGAVEGTVGAAIVEPLIYAARIDEQADYSLADSLLNVAFGGVFGASLHAGAGLAGDIIRRAYAPEIRETATGIEYTERHAPAVHWGAPAQSFQGFTQAVRIGDRYVPIRWAVMEADDLRATLERAENQYRDRHRAAGQAQIRAIAANLDFNLLGHSPIMDFGAPTLTAEGVVVGGNGRLAAIQLAYQQGTGGVRYRDPLIQQAAQFGLSPQAVAAMRKPVLVRILAEHVDTRAAAIASNEGGSMRMSALEQAKVDAERLGDLRAFRINEDGSISVAQAAAAVRRWVSEMPDTQRAALLAADGRLSAEGYTRLRNAILYRAYGDSPTLSRLVEAIDPGSRNVAAALTRVAGRIAETRDAIAAGDRFDLDLSPEIRDAVETLNRVREAGRSIEEFLAQGELLDSGLSPAAREVLAFLASHIRSSKAIADFIDRYYDAVDALGSPKQAGLFGVPEVPDKALLVRRAAEDYVPSAAEKIEQAPTDVQQAAARVAVAQAVEGQAINVAPLIEGDPRGIIAAVEQADAPDAKPLNDPLAAEQINALAREVPQSEQAELAAAEKALAETELALSDTVRDLAEAGVVRIEPEIPELAPLSPSARRTLLEMRQEAEALKPEFDAAVRQIAEAIGGDVKLAPLKGIARSVEKIVADYGGDPTKLKDTLRATIVIDSPQQARAAVAAIRQVFDVVGEPRLLLLEPDAPSPDGYRDLKFNVRAGNQLAEIQVNSRAMLEAKSRFHDTHYRRIEQIILKAESEGRDLTAAERAEVQRLDAEQRAGYEAAARPFLEAARSTSQEALEITVPLRRADMAGNRRGSEPSKATATVQSGEARTGTPSTSRKSQSGFTSGTTDITSEQILAQLPPEMRAEALEAAALADEAERMAEIARLASICATRAPA
jgi:hypothetical protein